MKFKNNLLLIALFFATFQICYAQESPKAELIDEFGNIGCEDYLARSDYFFNKLQNNSGVQGYTVIYGKSADLTRKIAYELWFNGAVNFRRMEDLGIRQIRSSETQDFKIQFWKVPAGAEKPDFNEAVWDFTFKPKTKPFIFYDHYADQICSSGSFEKVYAEYLNANPKSRGHIVIYGNSRKKFEKGKREVQGLLKDIDQKKLKFFYVKSDSPNTEFWLVPPKN